MARGNAPVQDYPIARIIRDGAGAAVVLMLAGCMSSGVSTFTQSNTQEDPLAQISLDVAAAPASGENPAAVAVVADMDPHGDIQPGFVGEPDPVKTASLVPADPQDSFIVAPRHAAASPQSEALRSQTEARLARLSDPDPAGPDATVPAHDMDAYAAERQAESRIPALFASIEHGQCKDGWGPKPKMVNVSKVDPTHRYYMEMRMRHTPLLPVGHVYIAYGRLGPDGEPADENLTMLSPVGGYVGAGIAGAVPMPGILVPVASDCSIQPEAAYRLSLSAASYEKLLLAIREQHEKQPAYHLFAHNCNHYMSEVAASVGILPPTNIYQASLTYFYAMMDRNEGYEVPRTPGAVKLADNDAPNLPAER